MKHALIVAVTLVASLAAAAPRHRCADAAVVQAKRFLEFHFGPDDRIEIEPNVTVRPPLRSVNGKDRFDVLEVWGYIYKGQYRMRLLYAQKITGECVLMGQEIVDASRL